MTDEDRVAAAGRQGPAVSRRGVIQFAGGAALATAAAGALGVPAMSATTAATPAGTGTGGLPAGSTLRLVSNSADLLVRDGTPHWWLSPDIWVVPGTDPNGPPGSPVAGDTAYVWARVTNTGKDDAVGAQVQFYWGNPAVQMLYSGITLIGTAAADIPAGESQDVLCLVPWNVVTVNDGHECLVVVATMPGDPPLPDVVDPVGYPNVAQRNLTVVSALRKGEFRLAVTVTAPQRSDKKVHVSWTLDGELPKDTLASLGVKQRRPARKPGVEVWLSLKPDAEPQRGGSGLDLEVPAGRSVGFYVTVRGTGALSPNEYQVVHVVERQQNEILGGISFVAVAE